MPPSSAVFFSGVRRPIRPENRIKCRSFIPRPFVVVSRQIEGHRGSRPSHGRNLAS